MLLSMLVPCVRLHIHASIKGVRVAIRGGNHSLGGTFLSIDTLGLKQCSLFMPHAQSITTSSTTTTTATSSSKVASAASHRRRKRHDFEHVPSFQDFQHKQQVTNLYRKFLRLLPVSRDRDTRIMLRREFRIDALDAWHKKRRLSEGHKRLKEVQAMQSNSGAQQLPVQGRPTHVNIAKDLLHDDDDDDDDDNDDKNTTESNKASTSTTTGLWPWQRS